MEQNVLRRVPRRWRSPAPAACAVRRAQCIIALRRGDRAREVVASSSVVSLVPGSGLEFEPHGGRGTGPFEDYFFAFNFAKIPFSNSGRVTGTPPVNPSTARSKVVR